MSILTSDTVSISEPLRHGVVYEKSIAYQVEIIVLADIVPALRLDLV